MTHLAGPKNAKYVLQFDDKGRDMGKTERNQPFLLILGTFGNLKEVSLIIDKQIFSKMKDNLTVVNILLLLFAGNFILNLDYPVTAKTIYQCLEYHLLGTCAKPKAKAYIDLFK